MRNDLTTPLELLAPAGKEGSVEAVLEAGADAVYLGGKRFNMRDHFGCFNFTDATLAGYIEQIHRTGALAYVVVNNMLTGADLPHVADHLKWLVDVGVDAAIVQDLAVLRLARDLGLDIRLHASTMMNVHSEQSAQELAELGVSRIVASRDLSLETVRAIQLATGLEMEYFVHGDMCIAQSGQCHHSGILYGQSSNRGRCMKACRWQWELVDSTTGEVRARDERGDYILARRDMAMYLHLPDVVAAGICSLKIEGRMREASYLRRVVATYRRALDRYLRDPAGYDVEPREIATLAENRVRDFSTCSAFSSPGPLSTAAGGQREPRFFSRGTREKPFDPDDLPSWPADARPWSQSVELSVRVADRAAAAEAIEAGADRILAGGDLPRDRARPWSVDDLHWLHDEARASGCDWGLVTPRVNERRQLHALACQLADLRDTRPAGVAVHTLGALRIVREAGFNPWCDISFNTLNREAAALLEELGATQVSLAPEAGLQDLAEVREAGVAVECPAHGPLTAMVLDYCVVAALELGISRHDACPAPCFQGRRGLRDTAGGEYELLLDQHCRGALVMGQELAMLPLLDRLCADGASVIRLDLYDAPTDRVAAITALYRRHLDRCLEAREGPLPLPRAEWDELRALVRKPLGPGAYLHGVTPSRLRGRTLAAAKCAGP